MTGCLQSDRYDRYTPPCITLIHARLTPPPGPNEAFRKQLKLYEAMKFTLDDGHPEFRMCEFSSYWF